MKPEDLVNLLIVASGAKTDEEKARVAWRANDYMWHQLTNSDGNAAFCREGLQSLAFCYQVYRDFVHNGMSPTEHMDMAKARLQLEVAICRLLEIDTKSALFRTKKGMGQCMQMFVAKRRNIKADKYEIIGPFYNESEAWSWTDRNWGELNSDEFDILPMINPS